MNWHKQEAQRYDDHLRANWTREGRKKPVIFGERKMHDQLRRQAEVAQRPSLNASDPLSAWIGNEMKEIDANLKTFLEKGCDQ